MAYLLTINTTCEESGCTRTATKQLMGRTNAKYGRYCEKHGKRRLDELLETERKFTADEL